MTRSPIGPNSFTRNRRAAALVLYLVIVPLAFVGYLTLLAQLEYEYADTKRHEKRVQARLLAESALAVARATSTSKENDPKQTEGEIIGIGRYRTIDSAGDGSRFTAIGEVELQPGAPNRPLFIHEFQAQRPNAADRESSGSLLLLKSSRRVHIPSRRSSRLEPTASR